MCTKKQRKLCGIDECVICFDRSFASHAKAILWSDMNQINPITVFKNSHHKFKFKCDDCGHISDSNPFMINIGSWCSYCEKNCKKLCDDDSCTSCFEKSFDSHEKKIFWDPANKEQPRNVFKHSGEKFSFLCICGHKFKTTVASVSSGTWCKFCENRVMCDDEGCSVCLKKSFASEEMAKYWSKDNVVPACSVFRGSPKKYKFDCTICGHQFEKSPNSITNGGSGCPFCVKAQFCGKDECVFCFKNSFGSHEKAKYWSNTNEIKPICLPKFSHELFKFDCECGHVYETTPALVSQGSWCHFCDHKLLCDRDDCTMCRNNSFASKFHAKYWSPENKLTPRQVFPTSNKKYKFICPDCDHTFESRLNLFNTTTKNGCPYCASHKLCSQDCKICFVKSFESHEKSKYWSGKNAETPRSIFRGTEKKYIFDCPYCKCEYIAMILSVVNGQWCGCILNKTENKLYKYLEATYERVIEKQKKFEWCKNKTFLPFDFCIEQFKLIIELDGMQHFKQISNWQSPEEAREKDKYKMKCANEHEYSIIRIFQEDVWDDKNDWQNKLKNAIKKYDAPTNIFIGDVYTKYNFCT
ncbi:MAG: restriction endonuclease [Hyperionvirus sp.]|uniref:Restriction endonuclease n=1 Tax=Hyperionvirus sp. TaxID=2487770 RepID=A0A3G5ADD0_9VIRU|nr:MAG: restriction endonuclease [Hyperionvirus sp.]